MIQPDRTTLNSKVLKQLLFLLQRFGDLLSNARYRLVQLMTMSAADFVDQSFAMDVLTTRMSASVCTGGCMGL